MIPSAFIDDLLARTDIVEIIESRVTLKKTGQNYSGLCPFHQEKSPSFSVSQDKQFYYCFGCQATGSALTFLMEFERLDFISSVEALAARLGLSVPDDRQRQSSEESQRRKSVLLQLEKAADFYRVQLRSHGQRAKAVDYLKNRGLSGPIARDFGLGFAPPGWDNLLKALALSDEDVSFMIDAGLLIDQPEEKKRYDRFRDRIIFPIRDLRGRTIAFGGRIIGDGKPKYLNSPETTVFHKGRELYGLYEARKSQAKLDRILVVEGYMDVVALAQHEIHFAVATLGTATTIEHVERLFRQVSEIIFCFDGDLAGRNAAWKALLIVLPLLSDGRSAKFLFLPDGEDPDSLVRSEGSEGFVKRLQQADTFVDWFFRKIQQDLVSKNTDIDTISGKAALSKLAMSYLNNMQEGVFRHLMIDELALKTGLDKERLQAVTAKYAAPAMDPQPVAEPGLADHREISESVDLALALLVLQPDLALEFNSSEYEILLGRSQDNLLAQIALRISSDGLTNPGQIMSLFSDKHQQRQIRQAFDYKPILGASQLRDEFVGLIQQKLKQQQNETKKLRIEGLLNKNPSELTASERQLVRQSFPTPES
ncbi:MAG TPA: DNA primase [Gammaproteobacteria bacterium]|nr:DNA primase [Gammaproteobacteria bacterium]HIK70603.1 DNA primase [Pseudomonadales bacterium]